MRNEQCSTWQVAWPSEAFNIDLVLVRSAGPYLNEVPSTVRLVDLGAKRTLTCLPALVKYLKRERPHAMVSALSRANILASLARKVCGLPHRLFVNEQNTVSEWSQDTNDWRFRMAPSLARISYRWATNVIAVFGRRGG